MMTFHARNSEWGLLCEWLKGLSESGRVRPIGWAKRLILAMIVRVADNCKCIRSDSSNG